MQESATLAASFRSTKVESTSDTAVCARVRLMASSVRNRSPRHARHPLLLLVHRAPFRPDKGDRIRSHHLLRHLAARYRVHLGAFVDDPEEWRRSGEIARFCASAELRPLSPRWAELRSLRGFLDGRPLTLPYFADARMSRWVASVVERERIERAVVFCSSMAPYVDGPRFAGLRRIVDFVDVDSEKWRARAERARGPMRRIWLREARRLLDYERAVASRFARSFFVTAEEAALFRRLAPESGAKIDHYENGVDVAAFDPALPFPSPYPEGSRFVVFTGAMDYWANADAVLWFGREVFPLVLERVPAARFAIVGARPAS
jgi:polysaccharide biosynthesis protein PslH